MRDIELQYSLHLFRRQSFKVGNPAFRQIGNRLNERFARNAFIDGATRRTDEFD